MENDPTAIDPDWASAPLRPLSASPTVQSLVPGGHLRRLREEAFITTEQAAEAIRSSHSNISRMEPSRIQFEGHEIEDLLTLYGILPGEEREALQVLPFQYGSHPAPGGPFTILRFSEPDLNDVVYIEQLSSAIYLDKSPEADSYLEVMEQLCLQAVPAAETQQLLTEILDSL